MWTEQLAMKATPHLSWLVSLLKGLLLARYEFKDVSIHTWACLGMKPKFVVETKGSSPHFDLLASSMSLNPWNDHLSSGTEGSSSFFSKLLSQWHVTSKICDIPCIRMGSSLNDSPKQSFVFLDGVSASLGSVSCRSLYKCEAPTLDSASLFIRRLVIPRCRIPDRTNELSNACRACWMTNEALGLLLRP